MEKLIHEPTKNINQSDIFEKVYFNAEDEELYGVLITPACDLRFKADYAHFCAVLPFNTLFFNGNFPEKATSKKIDNEKFIKDEMNRTERGQIEKKIYQFINNQQYRYQWLGEIPCMEGYWYVDFQLTECIETDEIEGMKRIASIASPLKESIPVNYATCMSRIGLPGEQKEKESLAEKVFLELQKPQSK